MKSYNLKEVEDACLSGEEDLRDPIIVSLYENVLAWIDAEQYGNFKRALTRFRHSASVAHEAGDICSKIASLGWAFIVESQMAMSATDSWLGATAKRTPSPKLIGDLQRTLGTDWEEVYEFDPDASMHLYRRLDALALLYPGAARAERDHLSRSGHEDRNPNFAALSLARWHYSQEAWEEAAETASLAIAGYRQVSHPPGIAYASLVKGAALLHKERKSWKDFEQALDCLVVAGILHPYKRHPVGNTAEAFLVGTMRDLYKIAPMRLKRYASQLDWRARERESEFAAFRDVFAGVVQVPSWQLTKSLPPPLDDLFWD